MSLFEFAGEDFTEIAKDVSFLKDALLSRTIAEINSKFSVGIGRRPEKFGGGMDLYPMLFIDDRTIDEESGWYLLEEIRSARNSIIELVGEGTSWTRSGLVGVFPAPKRYLANNSKITGKAPGVAGPSVAWRSLAGWSEGFLTAGHVVSPSLPVNEVSPLGTVGGIVGNVQFHRDPALSVSTPSQPSADVAVVELGAGQTYSTGITATKLLQAGDTVEMHVAPGGGSSAVKSDQIMGYCTFLLMPNVGANYGNCYMTYSQTAIPGDSGALVTDKASGNVSGLVVGGSAGFTTYIQEIDYLMNAITLSNIQLT